LLYTANTSRPLIKSCGGSVPAAAQSSTATAAALACGGYYVKKDHGFP
jgi:hypothetical protein